MKYYLTLLFFSTLAFSSCTGTQSTTSSGDSSTDANPEKAREEVILSEGYSKCEVVDMGAQDECGFVLQDLNAKKFYKPVQWEGEFAEYKKAGNVVYIKFRSSRITQTVCLQSMPILLDEMKLVE